MGHIIIVNGGLDTTPQFPLYDPRYEGAAAPTYDHHPEPESPRLIAMQKDHLHQSLHNYWVRGFLCGCGVGAVVGYFFTHV